MEVDPGYTHSVWHYAPNLRKFALNSYPPGKWDKAFVSRVRPYGPWLDSILNGSVAPSGELWPVCYGGNFVAMASSIRAVPMSVWSRAENSLSRENNLEEGHYMERTWAGLLTPRLSEKDTELLMKHRGEDSICMGRGGYNDALSMYWALRCGSGAAMAKCQCR